MRGYLTRTPLFSLGKLSRGNDVKISTHVLGACNSVDDYLYSIDGLSTTFFDGRSLDDPSVILNDLCFMERIG